MTESGWCTGIDNCDSWKLNEVDQLDQFFLVCHHLFVWDGMGWQTSRLQRCAWRRSLHHWGQISICIFWFGFVSCADWHAARSLGRKDEKRTWEAHSHIHTRLSILALAGLRKNSAFSWKIDVTCPPDGVHDLSPSTPIPLPFARSKHGPSTCCGAGIEPGLRWSQVYHLSCICQRLRLSHTSPPGNGGGGAFENSTLEKENGRFLGGRHGGLGGCFTVIHSVGSITCRENGNDALHGYELWESSVRELLLINEITSLLVSNM